MSLRLRLVLSVAVVVVVSFAALFVATARVVRIQFSQVLAMPAPLPAAAEEGIASAVAAHHRAHGLAGMDALLRRLGQQHGRDLILVDRANRIVATSHRIRTTGSFAADRKGIAIGAASLHVLPPMRTRTQAAIASDANRWLLAIISIAGFGALASTAVVARRLFRPIEALQVAVERVRGGQLGEEVAVTSSDEVGKLARAFNEMSRQLARDEVLRRNIVNDVAHELRTPLTNLICAVEAIQDGLRSADARVIGSVHDDLMLLQRLVDDLQTLALAEGGQLPLHLEALDVRDEIERAVRGDARVAIDVEEG
ncbi:MAG TPA: HAMP domain-containing protein, partial [Thermoanaerobaculia bacterium]